MPDRLIHHSEFITHHPPAGRHNSPSVFRLRLSAFTLVELLVVIMIIAVLLAIGVGVGMKLMAGGDTKETQSRLAIILNAVNAYHEDTDSFPTGDGTLDDWQTDTTDLVTQLSNNAEAKDRLEELPANAIDNGRLYDTFGIELQYHYAGGLGGKPVLRSLGPDGKANTEDDIRSDR